MDRIVDFIPDLTKLNPDIFKTIEQYIEKLDNIAGDVEGDIESPARKYFNTYMRCDDYKTNIALKGLFYGAIVCHYYLDSPYDRYYNIEVILKDYPEFKTCNIAELNYLVDFGNAMITISRIFKNIRGMKGISIYIGSLLERSGIIYVTGSGATYPTLRRVRIFEVVSGIKPVSYTTKRINKITGYRLSKRLYEPKSTKNFPKSKSQIDLINTNVTINLISTEENFKVTLESSCKHETITILPNSNCNCSDFDGFTFNCSNFDYPDFDYFDFDCTNLDCVDTNWEIMYLDEAIEEISDDDLNNLILYV